MPAKKAPNSREAQKKADTIRVEVPLNGLYMERYCAFPVWDSADIERENWLNGPADFNPNDPNTYFVDGDAAQLGSVLFEGLENACIEWRRPAALFSPFKPVVYRQAALEGNPYEGGEDTSGMSEEARAAREAAQGAYRDLRPLRAVGDEDEATARAAAAKSRVAAATASLTGHGGGGGGGASMSASSIGGGAARSGKRTPVPFLMGAFQSALMILSQNQARVQPGSFAWELIYPQSLNQYNMHVPVVNPSGKYAVRLFVGGAFRKVVIDDRLPADTSGRSILTVTDYKEIWPALLAKAIMKVLGPAFEAQIALNPIVTLSTLMCGWTPQVLNPVADELLVYRTLQKARMNDDVVLVATCSDSAGLSTCGAMGPPTSQSLQLLAYESALQNKGLNGGGKDPVSPSASARNDGDGGASPAGAAGTASANGVVDEKKKEEGSESFYRTHGLRAFHAYHIVDMRTFGAGFLLRLFCPGVKYTGPFSYESDDWTTELIDGIDFNPAESRNPNEIAKRWNDFWVSWDNFKDFFASFVVMRHAADTKRAFPHYRNFPADVVLPEGVAAALGMGANPGVVTVPGGIPPPTTSATSTATTGPNSPSSGMSSPSGGRRGGAGAGGAAGGGGGAGNSKRGGDASNTVTLDIPAVPELHLAKHQKTATRWVHLKNNDAEHDSHALIVLTGLPCPHTVIQAVIAPPAPTKGGRGGGGGAGGAGGAAAAAAAAAAAGQVNVVVPPASAADLDTEPQTWSVQVHRFDWAQSQPFTLVARQSCTRGHSQSFAVVLGAGRGTTLRITVENAPVGCSVAVTSPCEISSGSEREVMLDGSGIVAGSDAGTFGEHSAPSNIAAAAASGGGTGAVDASGASSPASSAPGSPASRRGGGGGAADADGDAMAAAANSRLAAAHTTPGQFSNPAALQTGTIWFKRHLLVKAETTASFVLSTLPADADLAAHRIVPQDATQNNAKGKKGDTKQAQPASQQQQQTADASSKQQGGANNNNNNNKRNAAAAGAGNDAAAGDDDSSGEPRQPDPARPITDFVNLILVDVETGATTHDTIGKMLNVALAPNKLGYVLMAVARTPERYRRGCWKLSYYASRVFDVFEPRAFEDVATRTGHYVQNDLRQVFRYNFCFPAANDKNEPTGPSATIQACLRDDSGQPVPFSIELRHSAQDPALASAAAAQSAAAAGGSTAAAAATMSGSLGASSVKKDAAGGKMSAAQAQALAEAAAAVDANGNVGDIVAHRTASHYAAFEHVPLSAHEKNTPSYYSLVCVLDGEYGAAWEQRRRAQVVDNFRAATEKQERLLLQQQWTRYQALKRNPDKPLPRELEQPPPDVDIRPGNIVFTVSLHFSNAKFELKEDSSIADALSAVKQGWGRKEAEERAAAAASSAGKKVPVNKKVNAKDEQQMADAIAAHFARAKEARERFLQNRKGIFLPYLDSETRQPVLDALSDPLLRCVPLQAPVTLAEFDKDPQRAAAAERTAALSKALAHAQPTAFAKKLVEHTVETTAAMRAARKAWITHINDTLGAHWAEVAPNKPLGGPSKEEQEQDDKRRRGPAGRPRR